MHFQIGAEVSCSDGPWGHLDRVVVDPLAQTITHLVVEPTHRKGLGRLVPVELVGAEGLAEDGGITLGCTAEQLEAMEDAEETQFLPGQGLQGYDPATTLNWPYFALAGGMGVGTGMGMGMANAPQPIVLDRVPLGEIEVHRGDPVQATDGDIGRVRGLVMDPASRHVTHVLLDEGHLWGKKQVAIPVSAVSSLGGAGIEVHLTKDEIRDLPPVELDATSPSDT